MLEGVNDELAVDGFPKSLHVARSVLCLWMCAHGGLPLPVGVIFCGFFDGAVRWQLDGLGWVHGMIVIGGFQAERVSSCLTALRISFERSVSLARAMEFSAATIS